MVIEEMLNQIIIQEWEGNKYVATGCWGFEGGSRKERYHRVQIGFGKDATTCRVHRVVFELLRGKIPESCELHHVCRNTDCVNPDHCIPMEPKDHSRLHVLDGETPQALNAAKIHCPRGHLYEGENLRVGTTMRGGVNRLCRECHREVCRESRRKQLGRTAVRLGARGRRRTNYEMAEEIRALYSSGNVTQRQLSEKFGLAQGTISRIVTGSVWKGPHP